MYQHWFFFFKVSHWQGWLLENKASHLVQSWSERVAGGDPQTWTLRKSWSRGREWSVLRQDKALSSPVWSWLWSNTIWCGEGPREVRWDTPHSVWRSAKERPLHLFRGLALTQAKGGCQSMSSPVGNWYPVSPRVLWKTVWIHQYFPRRDEDAEVFIDQLCHP